MVATERTGLAQERAAALNSGVQAPPTAKQITRSEGSTISPGLSFGGPGLMPASEAPLSLSRRAAIPEENKGTHNTAAEATSAGTPAKDNNQQAHAPQPPGNEFAEVLSSGKGNAPALHNPQYYFNKAKARHSVALGAADKVDEAIITLREKILRYADVKTHPHTPDQEYKAWQEANKAAEDFQNAANDSYDKWSKALDAAHAAAGRAKGTIFDDPAKTMVKRCNDGLDEAETMRRNANKAVDWAQSNPILTQA